MSYADELMSTGEQIQYRTKQHPAIFVYGARYAILALVIAGLLLWLGSGMDPTGLSGAINTVLGWAAAVLFIGGIAVAIWTGLRYINQEYVLTNRRVIQVSGVLNRKATDSSLEKINDAMLKQSFFGRMFDYGDLTVLTASESGIDAMKMLRSPIEFKKRMLDAKHSFEVGMEREGWAPPSPPIRDAAPAAAAAAAAPSGAGQTTVPGSASAPGAPTANPDEVTRTLASLADLRDRGAITPEEYEAKKADLLSRL
ncbi:MAG TPA: PH domain-containing protein [Candidatus Limnocylindrales bacterium]|nr:PH domain-containing protein [Candidatus Limnocylindrales bacterium]